MIQESWVILGETLVDCSKYILELTVYEENLCGIMVHTGQLVSSC